MELLHGSGGSRLEWPLLPVDVRAAVEAVAGAPVVRAVNQPGGFSPGLAARVLLADGRRVFVKAVGDPLDPVAPTMLRAELRVLGLLPAGLPVPRLLGSMDDGQWVAAVLEDVDGRPPTLPWRRDELDRVLAAVPSSAGVPAPAGIPSMVTTHADGLSGWRRLAGGQVSAAALAPALRARLDALAELEAGWAAAAEGDTLLHFDLRADNVLITDERVWIVDWPHAAAGAAWIDALVMLPSVAMQGVVMQSGVCPDEVWASYGPARAADPDAVNAVLAAAAGYFIASSLCPPPPRLPRIREFQRAQGVVALAWLTRRLGWPPIGA